MEGDAGASSRLNPTGADDASPSEVTAEDSSESEVGADQTSTEVTAEDSSESEVGADQTSTEVTAEDSSESEEDATGATLVDGRRPSRLARRGWLVGITAALVLAAGGVGAGGYFALRFHQQSQAIARNDAAAVKAAQDCVAATQAPNTTAMAEAARKMIECSTGDFGAQAALYSGLLADAYQASNAHIEVSDMRAAVERNNPDGSIDVLVALRTKVTNADAQNQEQGYRLRVKMTLADGQYKVSKLDQVAK